MDKTAQWPAALAMNSAVRLSSNTLMPVFGFGTFQMKSATAMKAVMSALKAGYIHIDTAKSYQNESAIGEAIQKAGVARKDLFITSKLWYSDQGYDSAIRECEASLKRLGTDYLDLYLIHHPSSEGLSSKDPKNAVKRAESWRALETLYKQGKCKAIGVSNYSVRHLNELLSKCTVKPAVNQVEFHPYLYQKELLDFCKSNDIQLVSYSPLMEGQLLQDKTVIATAKKYSKTPAQVLIRWGLQHGVVEIPKSERPERIQDNTKVFDFALSSEDMTALNNLNRNIRCGWPDPDSVY